MRGNSWHRTLIPLALLLVSAGCTTVDSESPSPSSPPTPAVAVPTSETAPPAVFQPAAPPDTAAPVAEDAPLQVRADLPDLGPAPEWANDQWINSDALTLADLRGKVVLLEFWTFG